MILDLIRCRISEFGTFGRLYVNDVFECYTLEPTSNCEFPCILSGSYVVSLNVISSKYRYRYPYSSLCHGKVPRLVDVPKRSGILIHIGNFLRDTKGCILVGQRASLTRLFNSTIAFTNLYKKLSQAKDLITINIENI